MTRKGCIWGWLIGAVALLAIFLVTIVTIEALLGQNMSLRMPGARVGLVRIQGVIADSRPLLEDLDQLDGDPGVKALVLRIESPGGGVAASQEIYERLVDLRDGGMPIVASMGAVAASGGYYIACTADTIVANPGTLTGSIGVIMSFANAEELLDKIGLGFDVVKSGDFKDVGSWSRQMTSSERAMLQGTIDDIHSQFVEVVSRERGLPIDDVVKLADGRIFSGRQAVAVGLVDTLGTLDDALLLAGRMAGLEGKPRVQEPVRRSRLTLGDLLTGRFGGLFERSASSPGAHYLYNPSK